MNFGRKHLPDIFYLEQVQRKSLRDIITREIITNTLIHREYTSSYQAKFVIEKEKMYVENANRITQKVILTPDNIEPNPKNPIIASFFRNIGYADQLGSGVRNLFKYSKFYSGKNPEFIEGDIFRIIVPLNKNLINDINKPIVTQVTTQATQATTQATSDITETIISIMKQMPTISQKMIAEELNMNLNTLKYYIRKLREDGKIKHTGTSQKGKWIINDKQL